MIRQQLLSSTYLSRSFDIPVRRTLDKLIRFASMYGMPKEQMQQMRDMNTAIKETQKYARRWSSNEGPVMQQIPMNSVEVAAFRKAWVEQLGFYETDFSELERRISQW